MLAYHKILIAKNGRTKDKREKDMLQAIAILREVFIRPDAARTAISYLETLPSKWKGYIKRQVVGHIPDIT